MLQDQMIVEFAEDMMELQEEGHDSIDAYSIIKDRIRNEHDTAIWEMVDSSNNILGFSFDDFLDEIMEEVEDALDNMTVGN
jgi:hypothetical protein